METTEVEDRHREKEVEDGEKVICLHCSKATKGVPHCST